MIIIAFNVSIKLVLINRIKRFLKFLNDFRIETIGVLTSDDFKGNPR